MREVQRIPSPQIRENYYDNGAYNLHVNVEVCDLFSFDELIVSLGASILEKDSALGVETAFNVGLVGICAIYDELIELFEFAFSFALTVLFKIVVDQLVVKKFIAK